MFAILIAVTAHACPIPPAAYQTDRTLTKAEYRHLESYGRCVCGHSAPDAIDYDVYRLPNERRNRFHPYCDWEHSGYPKGRR